MLLRNIYNVLYVDIKEGTSFQDVVSTFKDITAYQSLDYVKTLDEVEVNQLVDRNTSLLSGLLSFVFIAIILVLQTTLKYYFLDRKEQTAMIHILGGKPRYAYGILGIELFIEQLIGFIAAVLLVNMSIKIGMTYLASAWIYEITLLKILLTLGITLGIFVVMFSYYSYRSRHMSDMNDMKRGGDERKLNLLWYSIISASSLAFP